MNKNNIRQRVLLAIVFATAAVILGVFFPYIYYRFIDKRQYIEYTAPITFDKDTYSPCEVQKANTKLKILISSPIKIQSRLYLFTDVDGQLEVVKEYSFDTFFQKQTEEQNHLSSTALPCDLKDGQYFYRGVSTYKIKGIEKTVPFESVPFNIKN